MPLSPIPIVAPNEPEKTDVPIKELVPVQRIKPVAPIQPRIIQWPEPTRSSEPIVKAKELTPVKEKEPEEINEKLTNPPQNVNFSPTRPLKKIPQKMKFKGKPGRQRTEAQVEELLTYVQARGSWPHGISDQMQRYYKREYPEYFRKGKSRKKVQAARSTPIDISARRAGTGL